MTTPTRLATPTIFPGAAGLSVQVAGDQVPLEIHSLSRKADGISKTDYLPGKAIHEQRIEQVGMQSD